MIEKYLNYISTPRNELDGHAICPYAKKYIDSIWVWKTKNMKKSVEYYVKNFPINKKVIVLVSEPEDYNYKTLENICDEYQTDKLWLAPDHPNRHSQIGGIKTNNSDYAMILIQDREELKKYSDILQKTTYYNFWSEEYYNEIVKNR